MTKIAVLGGAGVLGSQIIKNLQHKYQCQAITRADLDLRNYSDVARYLDKHKFDVVVNCATAGCRQWNSDTQNYAEAQNNLEIFTNFFVARNSYNRMINIGSGAEFDLRYDIFNVNEAEIFNRYPADSYGWSKNVISRLCTDNVYTLRLFGCFANNEPDFRLLARVVEHARLNKPFQLTADRFFDYISIQDFCQILEYYITTSSPLHQDVNCVYPEKMTLSNFVLLFCTLQNLKTDFFLTTQETGLNYTGDPGRLASLGLNLSGLVSGLENYER